MFVRKNMRNFSLSRILASVSLKFAAIVSNRLDKSRIDNLASLIDFIHTRAAYVAQTSLYGYLKTRMGTRYRVIFEPASRLIDFFRSEVDKVEAITGRRLDHWRS